MEYFAADYADNNNNGGGHFTIEDLLDFSKEDDAMTDAFLDGLTVNSSDSFTLTPVESCNSSVSGGGEPHFNGSRNVSESHFTGNELCVPYDDIAELEWLSNFVEESFSNDDLRCLIPAADTSSSITARDSPPQLPLPPPPQQQPLFPSDVSVPGKARSKRSRAAPGDWSSRLLHVSPKREPAETPGRKCLHCGSEKTPQWRTGPMGPKTLCNACGVRYKSGRLVPEYRPAASPTFVSSKHSNSHRKVVELRRQKELQRQQQVIGGHVPMFGGCDEFLTHRLNGQDLRHMI